MRSAVQKLNGYQEKTKLQRLPSLLEYLSYIFSTGNLLAGRFCFYQNGVADDHRPAQSGVGQTEYMGL